ncbi:cell adhesion molecule 3-like isoform X1 [Anneissia japonica]|uniref:cell adhesion molecule 3-like isoform X1 n=1 Tax=Anneissia japonica TaxID=1529436 RepID=UPI001425BA27|nr:cell adhesion molecule 3-like isoform X1 [Anneissia japonica]
MCLQNIYLLLVLLYYAQAELFTAKPKDVEEFEGQIATLKCFLGEFIEAKYVVSWWKAGSKLTEQNEVVTMDERMTVNLDELPYPGAFSYSLLITNILLKDEGGYHCQIDRTPPITSGIARLTVLQVPSVEYPKCTKSANSYIVGSQVKLTCTCELLSPPVNLVWSREGSFILPMDIQTEELEDFVYKHYIFTAQKDDNDATFMCQQKTKIIPKIQNCTIRNLNIQYRPEVKIQHTSALFAKIDSILFCQSFANPPVTGFKWTFTPVLNAYEYITDGQVLTLTKLSMDRNGTRITCSAENKIGIGRNTMTLHMTKEIRRNDNIQKNDNDLEISPEAEENNLDIYGKDNPSISLYVVIIIIILVVIIVVVVVIIPVYYQCFCKTRTTINTSGREIYQPTVYYDPRDRSSNSGLYDRSLPRLPNTGHYGHWRHSFASQVPEDLDQQGYMYIEERNGQNTL